MVKDKLKELGFKIEEKENDWIAYRKTNICSYHCSTNGKLSLFIHYTYNPYIHYDRNYKVEIVGEIRERWYTLNVYNLTEEELLRDLEKLELQLVSAWNSIYEVK